MRLKAGASPAQRTPPVLRNLSSRRGRHFEALEDLSEPGILLRIMETMRDAPRPASSESLGYSRRPYDLRWKLVTIVGSLIC
jgi:hypothetical protein